LRRPKLYSLAVALAIAAGAMGLTACAESDPDAADTPDSAPTVANSAIQTDEEGMTIEQEPASEGEAEEAEEGDVELSPEAEAGLIVFNQSCTACHAEGGIGDGPIGPNLEGNGLSNEAIQNVIINGRGAMPGGLVTGQEFDEVVAYVEAIQ
jgi:mono/diheme cytochrome c family protein